MGNETRILETAIVGIINGVQFKCSGVGRSPVGSGESRAVLNFDVWPGLSPLAYGRSWKCGGHKGLAIAERPGPDNPFAQILADGAAIYSFDEQEYPTCGGTVLSCSRVFWREPLIQVVESTRMGYYSGPDNIAQVLPHTEIVREICPGKAVGECDRQMLTGEGDLIDITCRTTYSYPECYEFPAPLALRYDGNMVWKEQELGLFIDTRTTFSWLDS